MSDNLPCKLQSIVHYLLQGRDDAVEFYIHRGGR